MLRLLVLVRTDISEERSASIIRVTRICELGTTLAATSNQPTLRTNTTFLKDPQSLTSQKTAFFIVTAFKASNLTNFIIFVCVYISESHFYIRNKHKK
jgi:hypothetical protein